MIDVLSIFAAIITLITLPSALYLHIVARDRIRAARESLDYIEAMQRMNSKHKDMPDCRRLK